VREKPVSGNPVSQDLAKPADCDAAIKVSQEVFKLMSHESGQESKERDAEVTVRSRQIENSCNLERNQSSLLAAK